MVNHRDLALSHLAADERDALDLAGSYRAAPQAALDRLAGQQVELDRCADRYARLLSQYRDLRAQTTRMGGQAA